MAIPGTALIQFNLVDAAVALYAVGGAIRGFRRGLPAELLRLAGLVAAGVMATVFRRRAAEQVAEFSRLEGSAATAAGFLLVFCAVWLLALAVRWLVGLLMEIKFKGGLERAGGALVGALHSAVFAGALVLAGGLVASETLHRRLAEDSGFGAFLHQRAAPLYRRVAAARPDWGLPAWPEQPPAPDDGGDEAEPDAGEAGAAGPDGP